MERAKQKGWELYLYFVGTSKVSINQDRVKERTVKGEHSVPDQKIIDRYIKSNNFLYDASKLCRRVYIFDNSEDSAVLLAEKDTDGTILIKNEDRLPQWINTYFFAKFES
jgi:predicted ABC-type ATPase